MRVFTHGYFYVQLLYIIIQFQSRKQSHSFVNNRVRGDCNYNSSLLSLKSVLFLSTVAILFFSLGRLFLRLSPFQSFYGQHTIYFPCQQVVCLLARNTSETNLSRDHKTLMFLRLHVLLGHLCVLLTCILSFPSASGESLW